MLYQDQSRYAEVEPLLQPAVMICQVSFGVEHPVTQDILKHSILLLADLHTNGDVLVFLLPLGLDSLSVSLSLGVKSKTATSDSAPRLLSLWLNSALLFAATEHDPE